MKLANTWRNNCSRVFQVARTQAHKIKSYEADKIPKEIAINNPPGTAEAHFTWKGRKRITKKSSSKPERICQISSNQIAKLYLKY